MQFTSSDALSGTFFALSQSEHKTGKEQPKQEVSGEDNPKGSHFRP